MTLKRRTTSTIPFGYRESDVAGFLEPIDTELKALEETSDYILNGSLSLRGASEQLEHTTGRRISEKGLKKIVDKKRKKGLLDRQG